MWVERDTFPYKEGMIVVEQENIFQQSKEDPDRGAIIRLGREDTPGARKFGTQLGEAIARYFKTEGISVGGSGKMMIVMDPDSTVDSSEDRKGLYLLIDANYENVKAAIADFTSKDIDQSKEEGMADNELAPAHTTRFKGRTIQIYAAPPISETNAAVGAIIRAEDTPEYQEAVAGDLQDIMSKSGKLTVMFRGNQDGFPFGADEKIVQVNASPDDVLALIDTHNKAQYTRSNNPPGKM